MESIGKKVLITTSYRGVFFGTLKSLDGDVAVLSEARNCIYWTSETKGFVGLATTGPKDGCRIGPAAPELTLFGVTAIAPVTEEAAERWEAAPWN